MEVRPPARADRGGIATTGWRSGVGVFGTRVAHGWGDALLVLTSTPPRLHISLSAAAAVAGPGFSKVDYRAHAIQLSQSSWNREFSQESQGLNSLYLSFFFIFNLLLFVHAYGNYNLQRQLSYLHPMIKLFLLVVVVEYLAIFVLLLHYGTYASNGVGILALLRFGQVAAIVSRCLFMLLLILLAKGWTISRETLTRKWAIVTLVIAYLTMSVIVLIWSFALEDPMRTTPGSTMAALTIVLSVIWLVFAVVRQACTGQGRTGSKGGCDGGHGCGLPLGAVMI